MKKLKLLILSGLVLGLVFSLACSSRANNSTTTTGNFFPPAFWNIETTIISNPDAVNVAFRTRTVEREDSIAANVIYYFDAQPPTAAGQSAFSPAGTYYAPGSLDETYTWKNVSAGQHTFSAQLVNANDNKPFSPAVVVACILVVPPVASTEPEISRVTCSVFYPNPEVATPTGANIMPYQVQLTSAVHHFMLNDDDIGKQNNPRNGHYVYYDNVPPLTISGQTAVTDGGTSAVTTNDFQDWWNIGAGTYSFSIQVVNNDNTPLSPPLTVTFVVTLPAQL